MPPTYLGIGLRRTCDDCAWLAPKAHLRSLDEMQNDLEAKVLRKINRLGAKSMMLGGDTTAIHLC